MEHQRQEQLRDRPEPEADDGELGPPDPELDRLIAREQLRHQLPWLVGGGGLLVAALSGLDLLPFFVWKVLVSVLALWALVSMQEAAEAHARLCNALEELTHSLVAWCDDDVVTTEQVEPDPAQCRSLASSARYASSMLRGSFFVFGATTLLALVMWLVWPVREQVLLASVNVGLAAGGFTWVIVGPTREITAVCEGAVARAAL